MTKHRLTPRQKAFIDNTILTHRFRTITDAYIAAYKPSGSRRTAMASASRIYNKPAVLDYRDELQAAETRRTIERKEAEHRAFLASLLGR